MNRNSLLLLTTSYPDSGDGSEAAGVFVHDLAVQLSRKIPVRVVAPGSTERCSNGRTNLEVWRFAGTGRPLSLLSPRSPADWPKIIKVMASMRRQADAAVADGCVRHTLALWVLPCGWVAWSHARRFNTPYSVWALGSDIWTLGRLPMISNVLRRVVAGASACFADGLQLAADATVLGSRRFEFLPSTRRILLMDKQPVRIASPWRLLFLGRWHPNKGIDLLLEAMRILPEDTWSAIGEFTIAGGGPLESAVHENILRLKSSGRPVRLLGFLGPDEAAKEIVAADWVVVPSRIESIPVVLSDALKAGRPLVVTPVGDMARIVGADLPCGVVAGEATAASIASAIVKAIEFGPATYLEGVEHAAAVFDLEKIADKIIATTGLELQ